MYGNADYVVRMIKDTKIVRSMLKCLKRLSTFQSYMVNVPQSHNESFHTYPNPGLCRINEEEEHEQWL